MGDWKEGDQTAKGWVGRKFYLSREAVALLADHCKGTPLTMSAYIDGLIKRELDSPAERFLRGANQRETFTTQDGTVLPTATESTERHKEQRAAYEKAGGFDGVVKRSTTTPDKQPAKKEFDLDV